MKKNILREIFSGANGKLSAKRVVGGVAMAVALGCTVALVIRDGSNGVVENLLMTIFITSVSLLGLPAITSVWGNSKIQVPGTKEEEVAPAETPVEAPKEESPVPNCDTCVYKRRYNKKGTV
jgi:hypothetical protein